MSAAQLTEAQGIAPVVTVQNRYNLADRQDDELAGRCEREGIAFAPYFPLGGSPSLSLGVLDLVAARLAPRRSRSRSPGYCSVRPP